MDNVFYKELRKILEMPKTIQIYYLLFQEGAFEKLWNIWKGEYSLETIFQIENKVISKFVTINIHIMSFGLGYYQL